MTHLAGAPSGTWDLGDVTFSCRLLDSIREHYGLDGCAFEALPLNETRPARLKQIGEKLKQFSNDGRAGLRKPPFDFLPLVIRNLADEGGTGLLLAPHWPAQSCYRRPLSISTSVHHLEP